MSNYTVQAEAIYRRILPTLGALVQSRARNRRKEKAVAEEAVNIVLERTADGIDVSGKPFRPYSAEYAKFKRGAIKSVLKRMAGKRKNTGVAKEFPAWLRATGHMLRSLRVDCVIEAGLRGVIMRLKFRFSDQEAAELARYHDELGTGKSRVKRQFVGLSKEGTARRRKEEERLYKAYRNG